MIEIAVSDSVLETQTETTSNASTLDAALTTLTDLRDSFRGFNREAQRVLDSIATEIDYVNTQRLEMAQLANAINKGAFELLNLYSRQVCEEAKTLRKSRKAIALDRLDFLDTSYIWINKFGEPYWFVVSPYVDRTQYNKTLIQQDGDQYWGIDCPQLQNVRERDANRRPRPLDGLQLNVLNQMLSNTYETIIVCREGGRVDRIHGGWFKDTRAIDRTLFTMPLFSDEEVGTLLTMIGNASEDAELLPLR